jgi:GDPmannose 4,6-dehydratase
MLQQDHPEDFVIATGEQHSVHEFVEATCHELDIPIRWKGTGADEKGYDASGKCIVAIDPRYFRPAEVDSLLGDASKAFSKLGWKPRISFRELVHEMALEDFRNAQHEALTIQHRFAATADGR